MTSATISATVQFYTLTGTDPIADADIEIGDILCFNVPFVMSVIFMAMCVGFFIENRESGLVMLVPTTSLIFLFIAGVSWPKEMIPIGWRYVSYLIPYTWASHGFIHINSMGASLWTTRTEYLALWGLTAGYFVLAVTLFFIAGYRQEQKELRLASQSEAVLPEESYEP